MSDLEAIERRIDNVGLVRDIVSSMRSISASQLRAAADGVVPLRAYTGALLRALDQLPLPEPRPLDALRTLVVAFGPEQGLCGPLARRVAEQAEQRMGELGGAGGGLFAIGTRVAELFSSSGRAVVGRERLPTSVLGLERGVARIAERLEEAIASGSCDAAEAIHPHHLGSGAYEVKAVRIFPPHPEVSRRERVRAPVLYEDAVLVAEKLLAEWTYTNLYRITLEVLASEHGARLETTDAALRSVDRKLSELQVERNRARQEAITADLQEIMLAVEALAGNEEEHHV